MIQLLIALTLIAGAGDGSFNGTADGGSVVVGGTRNTAGTSESSGSTKYAYERRPWIRCSGTGLRMWCTDGEVAARVCADGTAAQFPLFRQEIGPDGGLRGGWEQVDAGGCPEDAVVPVLTAEEFARLPIAPSPVHLEPGTGRALVHYGVIAYTDPTPQTLTTTLLGTPITVTATPTSWTWDFGDTDPITTTDPGHPYPDTRSVHPYDTPGTYTLTLTTTWSGTYQVAGTGPVIPVTGTATTTSTPQTITVTTAHPQLVTNP